MLAVFGTAALSWRFLAGPAGFFKKVRQAVLVAETTTNALLGSIANNDKWLWARSEDPAKSLITGSLVAARLAAKVLTEPEAHSMRQRLMSEEPKEVRKSFGNEADFMAIVQDFTTDLEAARESLTKQIKQLFGQQHTKASLLASGQVQEGA